MKTRKPRTIMCQRNLDENEETYNFMCLDEEMKTIKQSFLWNN